MMFNDERDVHYTVASRISQEEGGGWEFYCQSCGYHARYIIGANNSFRKLEILEIGNPFVRHSSDTFDLFDTENGEIPDNTWMQMTGDSDEYSSDSLSSGSDSPYVFDIAPDDQTSNSLDESVEIDETWITPEIEEYFNMLLAKLDV